MTEKRFQYTSEKIGKHWSIEITDNQTKEPFDKDYIEINDNYSQTLDNVKFIVELLNESNTEKKSLKQLIKKVLETTPIEHNLAIQLKEAVREYYD